MSIGFWQIVLILVIVLIIFGAGKLPRVMSDLGKGVKEFRSGMKETGDDDAAASGADGKKPGDGGAGKP